MVQFLQLDLLTIVTETKLICELYRTLILLIIIRGRSSARTKAKYMFYIISLSVLTHITLSS